jgi:hypothetical protein
LEYSVENVTAVEVCAVAIARQIGVIATVEVKSGA